MKILSTGNSFSEDAHRYLHDIAKENGEQVFLVNLMIGGCSLQRHYWNMLDNEKFYELYINGEYTGFKTTIKEALKSNVWDYITLQQASHESFRRECYSPFIEELVAYVKKYSPQAQIYLQQTWAYPAEYPRLKEVGYETTAEMFSDIKKVYQDVAESIHADGVILSGEAMLRAYEALGKEVYRDAIHASWGFGRYLLGLVWFKKFFGEKENFKHISCFDAPVTEEEKELAYKLS